MEQDMNVVPEEIGRHPADGKSLDRRRHFREDDDQEGGDRAEEQREKPPQEAAAILRLGEPGVDQRKRTPADRVIWRGIFHGKNTRRIGSS